MKRFNIIFMVIAMLAAMLAAPVYAEASASSADSSSAINTASVTDSAAATEDEGTVRFYNFKYKNHFLYIKRGGSYYVCTLSENYDDSNFYFEKTDKLGNGDAIWHVDLFSLAEKRGYDTVKVANTVPLLCSDKYLYLPVSMYDKNYTPESTWLYCILKIDTGTGKYEVLESDSLHSIPWLIKKYNGRLYFGLPDVGLCYFDESGKVVATEVYTSASDYSQSYSKSKYIYYGIYGAAGNRYNLEIFNLDTLKRVRIVKNVHGYAVTDSKLYYGKIADARFKVYSASPDGINAKSIFSMKPKKGFYYELSRVTPNYIYYKAYDYDYNAVYYRYSRASKKIKLLDYPVYATNASDFSEGYFEPVG